MKKTIICDIDGTVAHNAGARNFFEWSKVDLDVPKVPIVNMVNDLAKVGYTVVFLSGRDSVCYDLTKIWLEKHFDFPITLFMRAKKDMRKDSIIKRELYENHILGKYEVSFVLDDRDQVISLWRRDLGLTCLQVDYGDF